MKITSLAVVLATMAGQAAALSCLRPDPITTFQFLAAEPDPYFVVYGQLTFDTSLLPDTVRNTPSLVPPAAIPARFRGKGLTQDGFTSDYIGPVVLQPTCAGSWCGSASSGVDAIYFAASGERPAVFTAGPCGGRIFENPSPAVLEMLTSCMQGGTCLAEPFE